MGLKVGVCMCVGEKRSINILVKYMFYVEISVQLGSRKREGDIYINTYIYDSYLER